jgi:hypothetical protein
MPVGMLQATLAVGRLVAIQATELWMVYVAIGPVSLALGVVNTGIANASAKLAPSSQLGGLFGILEAVEKCAGLIGPLLAGVLAEAHTAGAAPAPGDVQDLNPDVPIMERPWFYSMGVVTGCYLLAMLAIGGYYKSTVVDASTDKKTD